MLKKQEIICFFPTLQLIAGNSRFVTVWLYIVYGSFFIFIKVLIILYAPVRQSYLF